MLRETLAVETNENKYLSQFASDRPIQYTSGNEKTLSTRPVLGV